VSAYKSFFNPTNVLVIATLFALILFRHSLFPEASESTEVKQLMGKVDAVIDDMQSGESGRDAVTVTVEKDRSESSKVPSETDASKEEESTVVAEVSREPSSATEEADAQTVLTLWQTARRAAWDGNSDAAVKNYRALLKLQPNNYDAYGEMGNVLLQQGDTEDAVEAYSQASLLLAKSGYPQAAWHVVNIVAKMDQTKAEELQQTLYGTALPANQ
jgi:Flp pilus assembly protein TadD